MPTKDVVTISLLCYNAVEYLPKTIAAIYQQTYKQIELIIVDNDSKDGTVEYLRKKYPAEQLILNKENRGFSKGHNQAIAKGKGEFVLVLNTDILLSPTFIEELVNAARAYPKIGAFSGKLLRIGKLFEPLPVPIIDSVGLAWTSTGRHWDRGSGELDRGQYEEKAYIFGVTGAATLYRRSMLEDIAFDDQFYDEDFYFGHEDVDLAWRAQRAGWGALYIPQAIAHHVRFSRPDNIGKMPPWQRIESMKCRFMLRIKNMTWRHFLYMALPMVGWDILLLGYTFFKQPYAFKGLWELGKLMPQNLRKRYHILSNARVPDSYIRHWFKSNIVVDSVENR